MPHTPGPWHASDDWRITDQEGILIAQGRCSYSTLNQADANAKLLAAAPDLLTALRNIMELDQVFPRDGSQRDGEFAQIARVAIAKAEGRNHG